MTNTNTWPREFEDLVRRSLTLLPDDRSLLPDDDLVAFGLDSLGLVSLLIDLEDQFKIVFPEDEVKPETFSSAKALWSMTQWLLSTAPTFD